MEKSARITSEDVSKVAIEMRKHFLVPFDLSSELEPIASIAGQIPSHYKQPIQAFCSAIDATHATSSFPYLLASSKASALHFQRFLMAERIRNLHDVFEPMETRKTEEESEGLAYEIASDRFRSFQESDEGINAIVGEISNSLLNALKDSSTSNASKEVLYQGLVSLWSAFEVMVRDVLTVMLNNSPKLSEKLLSDSSARKYFDLPKVSIDDLSLSGYDLSNKMGSLLFGPRDFSDIRAIRAVMTAIFSSASVAEVLNNDSLWHLNQDRHLIVHRRGVVDSRYIQATGTIFQVGESVTVSPRRLEEYFRSVIKCATTILSSLVAEKL